MSQSAANAIVTTKSWQLTTEDYKPHNTIWLSFAWVYFRSHQSKNICKNFYLHTYFSSNQYLMTKQLWVKRLAQGPYASVTPPSSLLVHCTLPADILLNSRTYKSFHCFANPRYILSTGNLSFLSMFALYPLFSKVSHQILSRHYMNRTLQNLHCKKPGLIFMCSDAQTVQWWTKMCSDERLFVQWWITKHYEEMYEE